MFHIEINGVDVSSFYKPGSLKVSSQSGNERSSFSFTLTDPTTVPVEEQQVIVWNQPSKTTKETAGRIRRVRRKLESVDPADDTPVLVYEIEVGHWVKDVERRPPLSASYSNVTTGFIFRDLVNKIPGFSNTGVTQDGEVVKDFQVRQESILRAFDRLAQGQAWQWWIDDDKVFHFEDPQTTPAPFELTTSTYKELCGRTLVVEPDTDNLANHITMVYKGKYNVGTVDVSNGSSQVTAYNNSTFWKNNVLPGAKIRFLNYPGISYTIDKVVNDNLIILSGTVSEGSITNQPYVIEDIPRTTGMVDAVSQAMMAAITGDDGIYADRIEGPATYLTPNEAEEYLRGILLQRAYPSVNISFKSSSRQITGKVVAGQGVRVDLPAWGINNTTYQIREVRKEDSTSVDDAGDPIWKYDIRIETKLYQLEARFRKIEDALKGKGSEAAEISDYIPIIAETVNIAESVVVDTDVGWPPFVWGPSEMKWDSQADWDTWTHTNTQSTAGGTLELSGVNLTGSATSPWQIQYSPNAHKSHTYAVTVPGGASVVFEYRSADDTGSPGPWNTAIALVADAKYIQARATLTRADSGDTVSVNWLAYSPHKSVLRWSESCWMGLKDTWDSQADWDLWAHSNTNTADVVGSVVLTTGQNSGTVTSPWFANYTRTVAKVVTPTVVTPGVATITYEYRASTQNDGGNPTAWVSDIKELPDYPYLQMRVNLTGTVGDRPELQKIEIYPK